MGPEGTATGTRLLISDDEPDYSKAMKLYFEAEGYEVRLAPDPLEALELAASWQPHVIITDAYKQSGHIDGVEMTVRLKADETTAHIPVIVASSSCGNAEGRQRASDAGAHEVIAKPLDPKDVLRAAAEAASA